MTQRQHIIQIGEFSITLGGLSEKGIDKVINQDSFRIGYDAEKSIAYAIVADGLGSCKYSDKGSSKIADIIEQWILNQLPNYSFLTNNVANILIKRMVDEWHDAFGIDAMSDYDTTVHVCIFYKGSILLGGIGDGMSLVELDSKNCMDTVDDTSLFSNVTNSMCSLDVKELLSFNLIHESDYEASASVVLATDGIADDLIPEMKLTIPGYFRDSIKNDGKSALQKELEEWILDWKTEGHSDDKTICYLIIEKGTV